MKRLYIPIFVVVMLLTQWGSIDHDYHKHDSGQTCDYCLSAHALDHALTPTIQTVTVSSFFQLQLSEVLVGRFEQGFHFYAVRAPPHFI